MDMENGQAQNPVVQKGQEQGQTQLDDGGAKVSQNANAGQRNRPERTHAENDTKSQRVGKSASDSVGNRSNPNGEDGVRRREGQPRAGRNRNNRRDNRIRHGDEERVQQAGPNGTPVSGKEIRERNPRNGKSEGGRAPSARRERSEKPANEGMERIRTARPDIEARLQKKRVEMVEDIQADIERIAHDIDFEIKQIQTIRLGM